MIRPKKVYGLGSPVAHKGTKLNPEGYINREINKGKRIKVSTKRSGLAQDMLQRAAARRAAATRFKPSGPMRG